ncbi:hypothetical protein AA0498_1820 [Acidomonas methanolica]|nr:hypothetical protein AA0498_1820 [Acidomonas methanolica]
MMIVAPFVVIGAPLLLAIFFLSEHAKPVAAAPPQPLPFLPPPQATSQGAPRHAETQPLSDPPSVAPEPQNKDTVEYSPPIVNAGKAQKYAEEAKAFLGRCYTWGGMKGCMQHQDRFVRQYVNALAGDYKAQNDILFDFIAGRHDPDGGRGGAVVSNMLQACAWSAVIAASGSPYVTQNDLSTMVLYCSYLRPIDLAAAKERARVIATIIASRRVHPIAVPQIEYDPRSGLDEQSADK